MKKLEKVIEESEARNSCEVNVEELEAKIYSSKSNLNTMKVCIEEKDLYISTLEERIREVKKKSDLVMMQQNKVIIQQNDKIEKLEKSNEEIIKELDLFVEKIPYLTSTPPLMNDKQIKCTLCDFVQTRYWKSLWQGNIQK